MRSRNGLAALILSAMLVTSACMGDESEVARDPVRVPDVTPTAVAAVPAGIEVAQIEITDGAFTVEELILQQLEPTILDVVNHDDRPYRFRIGDLLTPIEIAPDTTTQVEFTTPSAERYEGELLAADDDEVVADIPVIVLDEGRTEP